MQFIPNLFRHPFVAHCLLRVGTVLIVVSIATSQVQADVKPSLNLYGATGVIDMPSAEVQHDGMLSITSSHFDPISRNTLSFQITPRISASFRFLGIRDWNKTAACQPSCTTGVNQFKTYYDRSFDLRFQVLKEGHYVPAVTIGLQDFAGTGILSGEYIAATKNISPTIKLTTGLGWGRFGSHSDIGSPLGARPPIVVGYGGNFNIRQWFRGPAAPFAGAEWSVTEKWTLKGEYSSDNYTEEAATRDTFKRKSSYNFGVEYQPNDSYRLGAYYMYGTTLGIAGQFFINPKKRASGGIFDTAPTPIKPRLSRAKNSESWGSGWIAQYDAAPILRRNTAQLLNDDGIIIESIAYTATTAQVRIRNTRYGNKAQAIGRTARALSQTLPASVETFEIVPLANGVPASKITIKRTDLETLEFSPDSIAQMSQRIVVSGESAPPDGTAYDLGLYPKFKWSIGPNARFRFFDQKAPFKSDVGLSAKASYQFSPGLVLSGEVTQVIAGNLKDRPPLPDRGRLQAVRSAVYFYDKDGTTAIEKLALHWHSKLSRDLFARVSVGYLERMFGGISTEVLWKPAGSRWALGAEVNYVKQRAPDQHFGFKLPTYMYETDSGPVNGPSSYSTISAHVSAYYEIGQGFHAQLDVGKYLAGDIGATFSIDRLFGNGWRVGAFATKTNVSAKDFGSGSFDKGIRIMVPMNWILGKPSPTTAPIELRPFLRDGGARLNVDGRLYETIRGYQASAIDEQFGRFWK